VKEAIRSSQRLCAGDRQHSGSAVRRHSASRALSSRGARPFAYALSAETRGAHAASLAKGLKNAGTFGGEAAGIPVKRKRGSSLREDEAVTDLVVLKEVFPTVGITGSAIHRLNTMFHLSKCIDAHFTTR
jgi:hypothetical protein